MSKKKLTGILILSIVAISLFYCKPVEIVLHGDIKGLVKDASTKKPVPTASVVLSQTNDSTRTGTDGIYQFKNLAPRDYDIQASKFLYGAITKNVTVVSAETKNVDFSLSGIPVPAFSVTYLDFGLDLTHLNFTISNIGKGKLTYYPSASEGWMSVNPSMGEVTNETDTISVTINRTGLSGNAYKGSIKILLDKGQEIQRDSIGIYINGLLDDRDKNDLRFYKVIKIGTQVWMAENLNYGTSISPDKLSQTDNKIIERYCYSDNGSNCQMYGGLYQWNEMMNYSPSDSGLVGTTQGICPAGWHIPTQKEWLTLINYLGGYGAAGGKLKESGTYHWLSSAGATNESGFTGLPGGTRSGSGWIQMHVNGYWWSSTNYYGDYSYYWSLNAYLSSVLNDNSSKNSAFSVRCVKN